MYPVQLVDVLSDTFRPFIESAINVSTELDEIIAGQAVKGYVRHSTACHPWTASLGTMAFCHAPFLSHARTQNVIPPSPIQDFLIL